MLPIEAKLDRNSETGSDAAKQKQGIREKVTRLLLENHIAIPDPVFHLSLDHYIPDFEDSYQATQRLIHLSEWQQSHRIFITPDRSTQLARETAIKEGKEIVVTTYGICRGAVLLTRDLIPEGQEAFAATLDGMERFGRPLATVRDIQEAGKIDTMLTGALAISRTHGGRTGKGAGWFDAEWILWRKMGLTDPDIPVIGIVHDLQVVNETFRLAPWDALVGTIVTPTRVLRIPQRQQPEEIYWEVITPDWLNAIPIMVELYKQENPAP